MRWRGEPGRLFGAPEEEEPLVEELEPTLLIRHHGKSDTATPVELLYP